MKLKSYVVRLPILVVICVLVTAGSWAQEAPQPVMLHDCDTLEGVSVSGGGDWPETTLELNTDPQYMSEGDASVHLYGVSPENATGNSYLSVDFEIGDVDMRGQKIMFDAWTSLPETTRALYVRGYNAAEECVLSYMSWGRPIGTEMTTIELTRGFSDVLAWEPGMIDTNDLSSVVRLRFYIGTSDPATQFDCFIDNIRLAKSDLQSFMDVEEAKPLVLDTPVVTGGEAQAVIVVPADDTWQAAATQVQELVRDLTGVELPIVNGDEIDREEMSEQTTIVIGNVADNPAMLYLYSHGYIFADHVYPGEGGYEVRTVHDPWGTGQNVLSIGASDPAGASAGIAALREQLTAGEDLVLDRMLLVDLSAEAQRRWGSAFNQNPDDAWFERLQEQAQQDLETGRHTGLFSRIASVGEDYQRTQIEGLARGFAWMVLKAKQWRDEGPTVFGGPWGFDSDFTAYRVLPAWDVLEESPVLTDEQRLEVTRVLFEWMTEAVAPSAASAVGSTHVRHNHQTFPALGCLYAGEYFEKYYNAGEGTRWVEIADRVFQYQAQQFKPWEDCNGYQWLTLYHTIRYCLSKPYFEYFENGNAARSGDYAIIGMDNLGYQVTYGDTGAYTGWWSEMPFLHAAEYYYRDGRFAWAIEKKQEVSGRLSPGWFATNVEPQEPVDLLGTIGFPLDPTYWESWGGPDEVPLEQAIDKVTFRNGFEPEDQYLLLDGLNNGGHHHYDGNSISRMTANGRIWLADASYMASLPKYHSTALVLRDGQSEALPEFCELEHLRDLPDVGFSETALNDYAGVNWHRNIFWLKGGWFLVADEMEAVEAGDYSFRILWHTIGDVELGEDGITIEQDGQHCAIRMTPEMRFTLDADEEYGQNWQGYEFIDEPVVKKLQGIWNGRLEEGEQITLFTLMHPSGEDVSPLHLVRLGPNQVAVGGGGAEPTIAAVGGPQESMSLAGQANIRGHAALLRPDMLAVFDAESIEYQWQTLDLYGGQDLQIDIGRGNVTSYSEAGRTAEPGGRAMTDYYPEAAAIPAEMIRQMIEAAVAAAPPVQKPEVAGADVPEMTRLWSYGETLENYLLTGNAGMFAAAETNLQISAEPEPLEANVFTPEAETNTVDNLVDGRIQATEDCTMWPEDVPVTLRLDFDEIYQIEDINIKAWFATSSSKNKLFQVRDITIEASDDGFAEDIRQIVDFTDTEEHGNWGAPGHAPHNYAFEDLDTHARNLRIHLTPREGTGIYIAEIEVWGTREGVEQLPLKPDSGVPVHSFIALHAADVDGDGADEVLAGSTNGKLYLFEGDGSVAWEKEIGGRVQAVTVLDLAGRDEPTIVAGGTTATIHAFTPEGEEIWKWEMPIYHGVGIITDLFGADLNGDGHDAVIAASEGWRYYAIDAEGNEIWHVESVRKSTYGAAADLDGDGMDEVVAGTEYHSWPVYDQDGSQIWRYSPRTGPGTNATIAEDITGDGRPDVVFAGRDGFVHAVSPDGQLLFKFSTGDEVMALATVPADGRSDVIAGSRSFNLYRIDGEGNLVWRTDLGYPIVDVATFATNEGLRVAATTFEGSLLVADPADGTLLGRWTAPRAGIKLVGADLDGDGSEELIFASRDGNLTALR